MSQLPTTLEDAIAQAKAATQAALDAGYSRLQVELLFPDLKPMLVAQQFLEMFEGLGDQLKVLFADAGAAALARRDWGPTPFEVRGLSELKAEPQPEDRLFLLVAPSSVEVAEVEKLCGQVGDRPVVLLNPRLDDVGVVGIGYAGRQLRTRFLSTFESCYYLRPLDQAALLRAYPGQWQVWRETDAAYSLITEVPEKPIGEDLDQILAGGLDPATPQQSAAGFLTGLQRFLRALGQ